MADGAEIVRLMRHAADRLDEEDPIKILPENFRSFSDGRAVLDRAVSMSAAVAYATAILRTVAAVLDEREVEE